MIVDLARMRGKARGEIGSVKGRRPKRFLSPASSSASDIDCNTAAHWVDGGASQEDAKEATFALARDVEGVNRFDAHPRPHLHTGVCCTVSASYCTQLGAFALSLQRSEIMTDLIAPRRCWLL